MNYVTIAGLGLILLFAACQNGAADLRVWDLCLIALGGLACAHFLFVRRQKMQRLDRFSAICAGLVMAFAVFQVVPLPAGLLALLSPMRIELLKGALPATGDSADFVTLSVKPYQTFHYLLIVGSYLVVFLLVQDLTRNLKEGRWIAVWPLLLVGAFEAGLSFVQSPSGVPGENTTGTYLSYDHFAGLLEMILPFGALYGAAILERPRARSESAVLPAFQAGALAILSAVILGAILHSLSRGGFVAAFGGLLVGGVMAISLRGWRPDSLQRIPSWRKAAPVAIVCVVILLGFIFLPSSLLVDRFAHKDDRPELWQQTTGLIKDYPLLGCGLGGFESCFMRYQTLDPTFTFDFAHNDYLQVLAEFGILGFLAGFLFVARTLQKAVSGTFSAASASGRYLSIACTSAMTAMLLHSLVDFNMYIPANAMVFAWVSGLAGTHVTSRLRSQKAASKPRTDSRVRDHRKVLGARPLVSRYS